MQVIRGNNRDRINGFVFKQTTNIRVYSGLFPALVCEMHLNTLIKQILIHITPGRHINVGQFQIVADVILSHTSNANNGYSNTVVGTSPGFFIG